MEFNTKAITLGHRPFGESDREYDLYTQEFGRILLMAPGARKIKAKLSGHLESPGISNMNFVSKDDRFTINSALKVKNFEWIKKTPDSLILYLEIISLLKKFVGFHLKERAIWDLCINIFVGLEKISEKKLSDGVKLLGIIFKIKFLEIMGHKPNIESCSVCGEKLDDIYFNEEKYFLCLKCAGNKKKIKYSSPIIIKHLMDNKPINQTLKELSSNPDNTEFLIDSNLAFLDQFLAFLEPR